MKIELDANDIDAIARKVAEIISPLLKTVPQEDIIYDVEGLTGYLEVNKQWVYGRIHSNGIPHFKMGKYPRFRKRDIDLWLEKHRKGPQNIKESG